MTHSLDTVSAIATDSFEVAYSWPGGSGVAFFDTLEAVVAHVRGFRLTTITGITLGGVDAYEVVMATAFAKP